MKNNYCFHNCWVVWVFTTVVDKRIRLVLNFLNKLHVVTLSGNFSHKSHLTISILLQFIRKRW